MLSIDARRDVGALLETMRHDPCRIPAAELLRLSEHGLKIQVDRAGPDAPVVYATPEPDRAFQNLSPREREVVTLLAAGFSNEQLASALFVSLATIKGHVHSIFAKTGFESRTQVVAAWYGGMRQPD